MDYTCLIRDIKTFRQDQLPQQFYVEPYLRGTYLWVTLEMPRTLFLKVLEQVGAVRMTLRSSKIST